MHVAENEKALAQEMLTQLRAELNTIEEDNWMFRRADEGGKSRA